MSTDRKAHARCRLEGMRVATFAVLLAFVCGCDAAGDGDVSQPLSPRRSYGGGTRQLPSMP